MGKTWQTLKQSKEKTRFWGCNGRKARGLTISSRDSLSHAKDSWNVLLRRLVWLRTVCFITVYSALPLRGPWVSPDPFADHLLKTHSPPLGRNCSRILLTYCPTRRRSVTPLNVSSRRFLNLACGPIMHDSVILTLYRFISPKCLQENMKSLYSCRGLLSML